MNELNNHFSDQVDTPVKPTGPHGQKGINTPLAHKTRSSASVDGLTFEDFESEYSKIHAAVHNSNKQNSTVGKEFAKINHVKLSTDSEPVCLGGLSVSDIHRSERKGEEQNPCSHQTKFSSSKNLDKRAMIYA